MDYKFYNKVLDSLAYNSSVNDKQSSLTYYISLMLNSTSSIFEYEGLPETMPQREIELMLKVQGKTCVTRCPDGELRMLGGELGGKPNPYYIPERFIGANPALNWSYDLKIDEECILMYNDSSFIGLMPLFTRYASQLIESDITMNMAVIQSRIVSLLTANTDASRKQCEIFIEDIINGKLSVVTDQAFIEAIKTIPYANTGSQSLTDLIEHHQYLQSAWKNLIGINSNYNMKRERIMSGEASMNIDTLYPLVTDMLNCRRTCWNKVNAMYGTNISVKLSSIWEQHEEMLDQITDSQVEEIEQKGSDTVNDESNTIN